MIDCPFCNKPTDAVWACPNCFQDFMNDPVHSRAVCNMEKPNSNGLVDEEKIRHYIMSTLRKQKLAAI